MPITQSFDPYTAEMISPGHMVKPVDGVPETIIVTFQPRTFAAFLDQYDATYIASVPLEEAVDDPAPTATGRIHTFTHAGHTLGAYLSPVGAPAAVGVMEQAIAIGVRRFVVFGTCGALVPTVATGGLIVPTFAYRDEGTSYHYTHPGDYIAVSTAARTAAILDELGIPHTSGKVWTTDGFFRETRGNLEKRVRDGCLAVDMETSALAALAAFRGVAVHQFLYAADTLADDAWDAGILGRLPAEPRARYLRIAAEIAVRL